MLFVRLVGMDELDHLDLIELIASLDTAHVPSGRDLLPAEAGGVGDVVDRQLRLLKDLIAIEVGDGYLGRRDQPLVFIMRRGRAFSANLGRLPVPTSISLRTR